MIIRRRKLLNFNIRITILEQSEAMLKKVMQNSPPQNYFRDQALTNEIAENTVLFIALFLGFPHRLMNYCHVPNSDTYFHARMRVRSVSMAIFARSCRIF